MTITDLTVDLIEQVRRMVAEPDSNVYTNEIVEKIIKRNAINDSDNRTPDNPAWTPTYDLNATASDIWEEKAGAVADEIDFNADGGSFQRSQKFTMYMRQAARYRSKSVAKTSDIKLEAMQNVNHLGWEDIPYKDWIDERNENLV